MGEPSSEACHLAQKIVERALAGEGDLRAPAEPLQETIVTLEQHLSTLIGPAGFQAVMSRALHLTKASFPWLEGMMTESKEGFDVAGLPVALAHHGREEVRAAMTTLLEKLIGLLCHFIGDALTLRIVRRGWPHLSDDVEGSRREET